MAYEMSRPIFKFGKQVIYPACFSTMLIPNQFYGEVPPDFVQKSIHPLDKKWLILDHHGHQQKQTFNQNHIVPYLTDGWFALLTHYHIGQPTDATFAYCGNGSFLISVGKALPTTEEFPAFHSHSTKPGLTNYFDITLSKYASTSSQLTLQKAFGDFIRSTNSTHVLLCNQHLDVIEALVLYRGPHKLSTKFGSGWRQFCKMERYMQGDTIRFKSGGRLAANVIHVRQLDDVEN